MTSREASREPARARPPVALSTRPPVDDAGIDVPWNSSAARQNWQPIETSEPEDTYDHNDQADGDGEDDEGDENVENVDEKDNDDNQGAREDAPPSDNDSQSNSQKLIKTESRESSNEVSPQP